MSGSRITLKPMRRVDVINRLGTASLVGGRYGADPGKDLGARRDCLGSPVDTGFAAAGFWVAA